MKLIYGIILLLFIGITSIAALFITYQDPHEAITAALEKGDVETLKSFFDEEIELIIGEEHYIFNEVETQKALEDFFAQNKPEKFTEIHRGESKNKKGVFIIGELRTDAAIFRVRLLIDRDKIVELEFEEPKRLSYK